jgi:hypothetical protein
VSDGQKTWTWVDKSAWHRGPWDSEPDKAQWNDERTGLTCIAVRHPRLGHWCGYVGVTPAHPLHGKEYEEIEAEVHGGLTFAGPCQEDNPEHGICHVPEPGQPESLWWFGFDCAHCSDLSPGLLALDNFFGLMFPGRMNDMYRDLDYVKEEVANLALCVSKVKA